MHRGLVRRLLTLGVMALLAGSAQAVPPSQGHSAPVELHIRTTHAVVLRVIRLGRPSTKPPLVLIPGWTVGLEVWQPVATKLGQDRDVVLLDSRSQGGSTVTTAANRPEDRALDLASLLRHLRLRRPILIGWSQGVQDLAAFVSAYGDKNLAATVLVDAVPSGGASELKRDPVEAGKFFDLLSLYRSSPLEYQRGMMGYIIGDPSRMQFRERLAKKGLRTPSSIGADMLVADLYGVDRTRVRFTRPLLVLIAGRNPNPTPLKTWAETNHAKVVVVADSSHALFVDRPGEFVTAIKSLEAEIDDE